MNKKITPLRPGLTAIAAVMAFSSTAALAQTTDISAAPRATITPAAPLATSLVPAPSVDTAPSIGAPTTSQSVAPSTTNATLAPISAEPASAGTANDGAPTPMATASHPVMHIPAASTSLKSKVVKTKALKTADSASGGAPAEEAATASPAPVTKPAPAPVVQSAPSKTVPAPAAAASINSPDETLEVAGAGAGAAAVLLLAGGAFALYRRNRRAPEDDDKYEVQEMAPVMVEDEPVAMPATATVAVQADGALPDRFDLSRFGPHVQAAYRGPTADNPSLSLKTRLKRARFFDMRERREAEAGRTPTIPATAAPARAAESASPRSGKQIVYRLGRVGSASPGVHRFSS